MASAATNDKAVLEQLVANTTTQYTAIKALLKELKFQRGSNNYGCNPTTNSTNNTDGEDTRKLQKRNATLQHDIVKGWTNGGLFSSHGHGVISGHDSRNCPNWKPRYVDMSTR